MTNESKIVGRGKIRPNSYSGFKRWRCDFTAEGCNVLTYVDTTGWQTVAEISITRQTARDIERLVLLLNGSSGDSDAARLAFEVLKSLEEEGLNFATEMELEALIEGLERGCTSSA